MQREDGPESGGGSDKDAILSQRLEPACCFALQGHGTGQAASKTLQVIKETGLTDLKYNRHCFTGTYEELLEWRSLPHVRFGVTWKTVTDRASADSVARMETKEILLETDAPFLPPYPECKINPRKFLQKSNLNDITIRRTPQMILQYTKGPTSDGVGILQVYKRNG